MVLEVLLSSMTAVLVPQGRMPGGGFNFYNYQTTSVVHKFDVDFNVFYGLDIKNARCKIPT